MHHTTPNTHSLGDNNDSGLFEMLRRHAAAEGQYSVSAYQLRIETGVNQR